MHAESTASTSWEGTLAHGSGTTSLASGATPPFKVSWGARAERTAGATSPEELIAAAHASCFAMAFSAGLAGAGATPEHLDVSVTVAFDMIDGAPTITSSAVTVRGRVEGLDAAGFAAAAEEAVAGCPVSRALMGNVEVTLDAALV